MARLFASVFHSAYFPLPLIIANPQKQKRSHSEVPGRVAVG
jgi:hypothetical protein